jgi:lysozyme family protein
VNGRFDICVKFVLDHETEYEHDGKTVKVERDPHDPGGTTKYGIDQRSHPNVDVVNLTLEQAKDIYRTGEWMKCRCENLKPGFDLAVFDAAVNIGANKAIKLLQQAICGTIDGFIGPKTVAATNGSAIDALYDYIDLREAYYRALPQSLRTNFLNGWMNRLADLRKAVLGSAKVEEAIA